MELGFGIGVTAFAAAYFAGYLAVFAPAGLGVRESSLVGLLTPILGAEASLILSALQRVWITATELVAASAGAFVLRKPAPVATPPGDTEGAEPATGGTA